MRGELSKAEAKCLRKIEAQLNLDDPLLGSKVTSP